MQKTNWLKFRNGANATHVLLNFGHHDLMKADVESYALDVLRLLERIFTNLQQVGWAGTFIWRTAPGYSHLRPSNNKPVQKKHEFRTNEKLEYGRHLILSSLQRIISSRAWSFKVMVMDTFSVTSPRRLESVDTHHYLLDMPCYSTWADSPIKWNGLGNEVGIMDMQLLLGMLCSHSESKSPKTF